MLKEKNPDTDYYFIIGADSLTVSLVRRISGRHEQYLFQSELFVCFLSQNQMAEVLAERTRSQIVQVIGKKIVLYREGKNEKKKIELPRK